MKISILTPNYNGARWLARGMDSVLAQELAPGDELEYIFLDGGSTDDSLRIAEARRGRLAALVSEKDAGLIPAWLWMTVFIFLIAGGFWLRFRRGRWKTIEMIHPEPPAVVPVAEAVP